MTLNILVAALAITIMAICNAVMDKLQFHFGVSIWKDKNPLFWNPQLSWRNKWKNGDPEQGEKFPGSSSIFVSLTDAWHLFKKFLTAALAILPAAWLGTAHAWPWWGYALAWLGAQWLYGGVFHLFFKYIFDRRERSV
jgi:hypothetical protein